MVNACGGGCYFDYINLHWYGPDFATFQSYVELAHAKFPVSMIWLRPVDHLLLAYPTRLPAPSRI